MASDHAGLELKRWLADRLEACDYHIEDHGTHASESCNYALFAEHLCRGVIAEQGRGILICGSGIGMSMAANRFANIRAALCTTELHASLARKHNDANVLCLGARITGTELALAICSAFLDTQFEKGRHMARLAEFSARGVRL